MTSGRECGLRQRGGKKSTSSSLKIKSTKRSFKRNKNSMKRKSSRGSKKTMRRGMLKKSKMSKKSTMSKPLKKAKKAKKTKKKGKKPLNAYMKALKKARDNNEPSFTYNGKTYYQKKTKTGMIIYGAKK